MSGRGAVGFGHVALIVALAALALGPRGPAPAGGDAAPRCGSVTDRLPRELPRFTPPATGASYVDPVFGCTITRLSNAAAERLAAVTHIYSSVSPFNADSTLVLVQKLPGGVMHIRDLHGKIVRDELWEEGIQPRSEAVWSRTDPKVLYYHPIGRNQLASYDVAKNRSTVLHTFSKYSTITFGGGESDLSWDGDHLPVVGDGTDGFIYTISTGEVTPAQNLRTLTGGQEIDVFDVTPSNHALLRWGNRGGGVMFFGRHMEVRGRSLSYAGHSDRDQDADGADLEVASNAADPTPIPNCVNAIVKVRLADGAQTCLQSFDWSLAQHVSCNNVGQGWCLVTTYMGTPGAVPYANELVEVWLGGAPTVRLAHTGSTNGGYDHFPRAAVSPDGRYVLFDSDMQGPTVDVYLLDVPKPERP